MIILILIIIIFILFLKEIFLKKSLNDIINQMQEKLKSDTNTIITINSNNKQIQYFANNLNKELISLRKQKLQYENGNQELKKSITNISHDLRTPLTAISGYTDLLQEEELTEKQFQYVKVINNKTKELIDLTEQLFNFTKILDVEKEIKKENLCINDILEETIASFYKIFKEKNIIPNIQITKKKIFKNVDKIMIVRIFENLISNSIKYSDKDCNIKLNEDGKIIFFNKASKLDVTTIQKIFDRYYTVENAKNNSGVGLSIAKQLVEMNEGTIIAKYIKNILYIEIDL